MFRYDQWEVSSCSDAHVPAALLKLWLRELYVPLIPGAYILYISIIYLFINIYLFIYQFWKISPLCARLLSHPLDMWWAFMWLGCFVKIYFCEAFEALIITKILIFVFWISGLYTLRWPYSGICPGGHNLFISRQGAQNPLGPEKTCKP